MNLRVFAILVIAAVILLPSRLPGAPAAAEDADWRTTFNNAYSLAPKQNLKFIPPGQVPQRKRYFAEVEHNDSPMPCIQWRWIGGKVKREAMSAYGPDGAPLSRVLQSCANLDSHHAPTDGLAHINVNGDWIVRDGASTEAVLADLHAILLEQFKTDIRFEKTETVKEALVATGKYRYHRLAEDTMGELQIFADKMDHPQPGESAMGGGTTAPDYLWVYLGEAFAIPIVDETTGEPPEISWFLSRSIVGANQEPARRQQILDNITKQTGITFKQEKRSFVTWKLTSANQSRLPATRPAK